LTHKFKVSLTFPSSRVYSDAPRLFSLISCAQTSYARTGNRSRSSSRR
jgi:hypothetical protein